MIIFRNSLETTPVGRDIKNIKADFLNGTIPSWLNVPSLTEIENNGIATSQAGTISSMPFIIENNVIVNNVSSSVFTLESVSLKVSNWRMGLETNNGSIKLVSSNNVAIGVYGVNSKNYFRIYPNGEGSSASVEEEVGTRSNGYSVGIIVRTDNTLAYTSRPKNVEIVLQPEIGQFHVGINGGVAYTYWALKTENIDWSGTWHFEVECDGAQYLSSVELEMQQSI